MLLESPEKVQVHIFQHKRNCEYVVFFAKFSLIDFQTYLHGLLGDRL